MELFYGPTLAFKDYALQVVGRMFDTVLKRTNRRVTIVGATSGDTGSAAIEACKGCAHLDIFILHPHNRVSEVQRRQMTTTIAPNVFNIALEGTFDDCQSIVKALFSDEDFRARHSLSAVNSINWARIMAQIVYYFRAALALGAPDREVSFAVPTGNFGNIFAGYAAKRMGLPIKKLMLGSNENDILPRFLETGVMEKRDVKPSISPSMDIQVSSNFERLLFEMQDHDTEAVSHLMETFKYEKAIVFPRPFWNGSARFSQGSAVRTKKPNPKSAEFTNLRAKSLIRIPRSGSPRLKNTGKKAFPALFWQRLIRRNSPFPSAKQPA